MAVFRSLVADPFSYFTRVTIAVKLMRMSQVPHPRVAVLMGGQSSEHEVSLRSGAKVVESLQDIQPVAIVIGKEGTWSTAGRDLGTLGRALDYLKTHADVVFIAMHGPNGEDGTIQGLLEVLGLPYTGSAVLGSALAMDKVRAKWIYQARSLPTAPFQAITRAQWAARPEALVDRLITEIGAACVLKPARAGSSVGIRFPKTRVELREGIDAILLSDDLVLAERFIAGREFTCGVLSVDREQRTFALPVTEIVPDATRYAYFDYTAKYTPGGSQTFTPANIDALVSQRIQTLAVEAHLALDCRDFSRTDFRLDADSGEAILLETNTIPGMTAQSLLPQAALIAGYDFRRLLGILLDNAILRAKKL